MNPSELQFEESKTETYTSAHYVFHYLPGSAAERDIEQIAAAQEGSFAKICRTLRVTYPEKINYYFTDSPLEIGRIFWEEGTPCNGVALCGDNKIYAVYSDEIKCIGAHEDTHLISFLLGYPQSDFVVEGLAMFMDGLWWGVANEVWTAYYKAKHPGLSVAELFDNDVFAGHGCIITYPIAGAFARYLIDTYGMERYLAFYQYDGGEYEENIQSVFDTPLYDIENSFWAKMGTFAFDPAVLEEMLGNEGF